MPQTIRRLSQDHPAVYQIVVPGLVEAHEQDWAAELTVTFEYREADSPVTVLTGVFDQAALHGMLRRLYGLGLPLIAVTWINPQPVGAA